MSANAIDHSMTYPLVDHAGLGFLVASCAFENDVISNIDPHAPPHRYICAPAEAPGALEEADPCEWEGPAGWLPACVASRSNAAAAP